MMKSALDPQDWLARFAGRNDTVKNQPHQTDRDRPISVMAIGQMVLRISVIECDPHRHALHDLREVAVAFSGGITDVLVIANQDLRDELGDMR